MKQIVMTSVYGVTSVGAQEQIKRGLEEKGLITDDTDYCFLQLAMLPK